MIESATLPPQAVEYLNQIEQPAEVKPQFNPESAKQELLTFCNDFIEKSKAWRTASYETNWIKYQRLADGIYDPELAAQKEAWQSKVHVDLTASHRESIHSYLFKVMCGSVPLDISPRFELGALDQSKNIKDIILREMDKAEWEVEYDKTMHDADTYGSGFMRRYWVTETAVRKLKVPVQESFMDNLNPMGMAGYAMRAATGNLKTVAYKENQEEVITYRGLKVQNISIWNVFKTPKSIGLPKGTTVAIRYWMTYGDVIKGVKQNFYLPEAIEKLAGIGPEKKVNEGEQTVNANRGVSDGNTIPTTDYSKELCFYELFGMLPKKWIYTILSQPINGDPEELVGARVIFHKSCPVAVEINNEYDSEPPIHQLDYFPKNGDSYGRGIPEMLATQNAVINEVVNQRLDNGAQSLNHHFAVIENALVNPKEDLKSKVSCVLRLDAKKVTNGVAANAIAEMPISDSPLRAGFSEVYEWERIAQERTSANRTTLGTAGQVRDTNKTLGGQQLQRESAGEKFSYIGLMQELSFNRKLFHGIWKTIYANMDPTDIEDAIGPERVKDFILLTPEEVANDYVYKCLGVFTMENKTIRQARLTDIRKQFLGAPWIDDEKFYDAICRTADEDGEMFKKSDNQIIQDQADLIPPEQGQGLPPQGPQGQGMPMPPMQPPMQTQA